MLMMPKMIPFLDLIVRYDPSALPSTGATADTADKSWCILLGLPIFGLVAYTVKVNVWISHSVRIDHRRGRTNASQR